MGRVLQMYESEAGHMLSNAELEAMAWNEVGCHNTKRKGKCTGQCNSCVYGQGHALMNAVDPFQRMVINDRADRHIMSQMVTLEDVTDKIIEFLAGAFAVGFFTLIGVGIYKAGRYAQWW